MLKVTNDRVVRLAPPHSAPARLASSGQLAVCPGVPVSRCPLARPVPARAQCLKFETDQAQDVKRLEKLNTLFFSYMCGKDPQAEEPGSPLPWRAQLLRVRGSRCTLGHLLPSLLECLQAFSHFDARRLMHLLCALRRCSRGSAADKRR